MTALFDTARTAEWERLLETSHSATCYQGPAFAQIWWQVYGDQHELALAEGVDAYGRLAGQMILVRPSSSGEWKPVGREQSEYAAVLCRGDAAELTTGLLRTIRAELGLARLRFLFLPPGVNVDAYLQSGTTYLRVHPRPLRQFSEVSGASKRTKEKLSKLRKLGARVVVHREGADLLAFLGQFVPMHDARQGELGHGAPFRDDPRKAAFLVALASRGRLVHAAGLMIGETLAAGIVCVQNGSQLVLSQLAHAKDLDALSPAACLIHLLAREYEGTEITTLDLTPGGAYKERFATSYDTAYALDVAWSPVQAAELLIRREFVPVARRLTDRVRQIVTPGFGKATAGLAIALV